MELLADLRGSFFGRVAGVVADHQGVGVVHASQELLALHGRGLSFSAQLDDAVVKLLSGGEKDLEEIEDVGDVAQRDVVVKLKTGEAQKAAVDLRARALHGRGELVDRDHEVRDVLELQALAAHVDVDDRAAFGDRDDHGLGEKAHTGGGAVARARLGRGKRRVGVEVVVCAQDLGEVLVQNYGAVHLAQLEEAVCREGNVQLKAVVAGGQDVFCVADADKCAHVTGDDHVEGVAQGGPRRRLLDGVLKGYLVIGGKHLKLSRIHGGSLRLVADGDAARRAGARPGRIVSA